MEFTIKGIVEVRLEHRKGDAKSKHLGTDFNLETSPNMDKSVYFDKEGLPSKEGSKVLTHAFLQGLIGNIHFAHQAGFMNDAEHIRYVISELQRGFVTNAEISKSEFK